MFDAYFRRRIQTRARRRKIFYKGLPNASTNVRFRPRRTHTFVQTFAFVFAAVRICWFVHARTPVRQRNENDVDWDEGKSDGRTKRKKERVKGVRVWHRARSRGGVCVGEKEGIQYNCTHVYRVDGNILERILKYLLVV